MGFGDKYIAYKGIIIIIIDFVFVLMTQIWFSKLRILSSWDRQIGNAQMVYTAFDYAGLQLLKSLRFTAIICIHSRYVST